MKSEALSVLPLWTQESEFRIQNGKIPSGLLDPNF